MRQLEAETESAREREKEGGEFEKWKNTHERVTDSKNKNAVFRARPQRIYFAECFSCIVLLFDFRVSCVNVCLIFLFV